VLVGIYDNYFDPAVVQVLPGGTIRWVNLGRHKHTVTGLTGGWGSGDISPEATFTFRPSRDLNHFYYCRHHRLQMTGTILVRSPGKGAAYGQPRPGY
jgi:plastocyanin